jgi:hypothetical protein
MLARRALQVGLISIFANSWQGAVSAAEETLWPVAEAAAFCAALPPINDTQLQAALGEYAGVVQQVAPASLQNLKRLDIAAINSLVERAVSQGWGVLELITDKNNLVGGACSMLMEADTLQQVDARYNLHSLWMINAPLDGAVLPLRFLLFGEGKLVLGYPRSAVVKVSDYDFSGGKYAYTPLVMAVLRNTAVERGLTDIQVMAAPQDELGSFKGPRGSSVHAMLLQGDVIHVRYSLLGITGDKAVPNLKIEKR